MKSFIIFLSIAEIFLYSCDNSRKINKLMLSNNPNDIIEAAYLIGESRNTKYLKFLLNDIDDFSTATSLSFLGISIYQSKISALRKISGYAPPNHITYRPDSVNIKFYDSIFRARGYSWK